MIVVWTESRNYTAYDLEGMLRDMGLPQVASLYKLEKNDLLNSFAPPMIDVRVCLCPTVIAELPAVIFGIW